MPELPAESVPVQLTRMEGVLNNVNEKVGSLIVRVDRHERDIGDLKLDVQRLDLDAKASAATVKVTAEALKNAKEAQDASDRAEQEKAEQSWSPVTKMFAVATFISTIAGLYFAFRP